MRWDRCWPAVNAGRKDEEQTKQPRGRTWVGRIGREVVLLLVLVRNQLVRPRREEPSSRWTSGGAR